MTSKLPAPVRVALRRVQLAVHPNKMQQPEAREANTASLALLNAYVDLLEQPPFSLERMGLRSVQLRFLLPHATPNPAAREAKRARKKREEAAGAKPPLLEIACTLPGSPGSLAPLFSAFAPVIGAEVAAAAGTGGEEDEASGEEASAPAGAAPADVQDSVDWLRSVASDAVAARTAHVSRTNAQDEATAALSRKHGIRLHISTFACREKVELTHIAAFDAALSETAKSTVRHLQMLTLILLDETERVPEGGMGAYRTSATYSSDAERRAGRAYMLERNHSDEVFLHLALSSSAADYAASLSAIAAALPTVTRGVAAAAADTDSYDELRRQAAEALQVTFVYSFWISPEDASETRHRVADLCRAVVTQPAPPRRRHVPVGVRV